ncbi:MAG TPA: UxaA family hydrolase, partial [Rhizomicrobium sp.]
MSDVLSNDAVTVRLHGHDNVVIATRRIAPGTRLAGEGVVAREIIPSGHKIATQSIPCGSAVRKYGQVIGVATADIAAGAHVHVQNLAVSELREEAARAAPWHRDEKPRRFLGYARADGRVGTRNYVGILTSVTCSATVARHLAEAAERSGLLRDFPHVDGIVPITHTSGCGMAGSGEGFEILKRTLWGTAANANFGAILLVGLGCEVLQIDRLKKDYGLADGAAFQSYTIQDVGGTRRAIAEGLERLKMILPQVDAARRTPQPASALILGLQCGGSDAWSGVTSNPALGDASDRLAALGGTVILSETPEIYGAEHLLYARAKAPDVSAALRARLDWWEHYTR